MKRSPCCIILIVWLAALGQAWMWLGVKALVPSEAGKRALVSVFLVPSVVFWSSSMFKEAFALIGMGLAVFGAARLVSGEAGRGGLSLSLGVITVGLSKAYVLFPLAITAGIYAYWTRAASRGGVRLRPTRLLGGVAAIVVMLVLLGKLFPNYAVDSVAETINQQQEASLSVQGGSDFRLGESDTPRERGALGLLKDMPFTIATALLRPLFFEARSAMVLINSLETSVFLYLLITAFGRTGRVELARWVWRTPAIMASIVFVFVFSAAVGLATTNLGALSRYRLPMMPFYAYVVLSAYALPSRQSGRGLSQRSSSGGDVLAAELPHRRRAI